MKDIHSCGYYCDRPECIKAQRDELRQRLIEQSEISIDSIETVEIEIDDAHVVAAFRNRLAQAIEAMPFGDTAASFAAFVRGFE